MHLTNAGTFCKQESSCKEKEPSCEHSFQGLIDCFLSQTNTHKACTDYTKNCNTNPNTKNNQNQQFLEIVVWFQSKAENCSLEHSIHGVTKTEIDTNALG